MRVRVTRRPARKSASSAAATGAASTTATATAETLARFRCALCGVLAIAAADSHPRCPDCNIHLIQVTKPLTDN